MSTDTASSPSWWPMAEARGENSVRSAPRSRCSFSWLASMVSRISSSLMRGAGGRGRDGSLNARQLRRAKLVVRLRRRRVVAVAVDDHAVSRFGIAASKPSSKCGSSSA